jgi:hypothetical protein
MFERIKLYRRLLGRDQAKGAAAWRGFIYLGSKSIGLDIPETTPAGGRGGPIGHRLNLGSRESGANRHPARVNEPLQCPHIAENPATYGLLP